MTEKMIPEHIDPFRFAEQNLHLDGGVNIRDLHRLSEILDIPQEALVSVDLRFGKDEQGIPFLRGHLQTQLKLSCQRCMETFTQGMVCHFTLGIVNTLDEASLLPERYEPVLTKEGNLAIKEMVEDELILNLPLIPKHELENCKVRLPIQGLIDDQKSKKNPFHVLESLKDKQR